MQKWDPCWRILLILVLGVVGCAETSSLHKPAIQKATSTYTPTLTFTASPSITPTPAIADSCIPPYSSNNDEYARVTIVVKNPDGTDSLFLKFNIRTYEMLRQAVGNYKEGEISLLCEEAQDISKATPDGNNFYFVCSKADIAITQGSFRTEEPGWEATATEYTHGAGGAVDISIKHPFTDEPFPLDEIFRLVESMRVAGFAAWYRAPGEEGEQSTEHIHAISIGDEELSEDAKSQLVSDCGYFQGFTGIPVRQSICAYQTVTPTPFHFGESIICPWMCELGILDSEYQAVLEPFCE